MLKLIAPAVQIIAYSLLALGQIWLMVRWAAIKFREAQDQRAFLDELKNNHLKHIYKALKAICKKLDIDYDEPEGSNGRDKTS